MIQPNPYLSVAIPTYNRRDELAECLNSILPQAQRLSIRICISDNASDYDISSLIDEYRAHYPLISFRRNAVNLGIDANVRGVMAMVESTYVWVFSDDDRMVEGALDRVVPLCESGKYTLILPDRELRSRDMSRRIDCHSNVNGVTQPTEFDDPVALFARHGFWHYTFIGSLLVRLADWRRVPPGKYAAYAWFEHTCVLAEIMLEGRALVLPDPLVQIRCDNNTYRQSWWSVWGRHFPAALAALSDRYPPTCLRQVLADFVRASGQSPLRFMMNGRAMGVLDWTTARAILKSYWRLRARTWVMAGCVALAAPRLICVWLKRLVLKGAV